jgi:ribosomal protein S18 acetylase RimI-like enzyme
MRVKLSLRPATPADAPFLQRVYRGTREAEMAQLKWTEAQKDDFCAMQFAYQARGYHAAYPDAEFLVVLCDGEPVGRLYRATADGVLHVLDVSLLPPWRNLGIGTRLMRETMAAAEADRLPVQLHVDKSNRAQHLYARLGFRQIEDTGIYLRLEWRAGN